VLKQVHPDTGISSKAMSILNSFITDMFEKIATAASGVSGEILWLRAWASSWCRRGAQCPTVQRSTPFDGAPLQPANQRGSPLTHPLPPCSCRG
jgi:hypothetical protein